MRAATTIVRLLLGLVFTVFGLNFFLQFIPMPPKPPEATNFVMALFNSGYLMQVTHATELICGLLLLSGVLVPLALVVLAPVLLNILLFHVFMTPPKDWALPVILTILEVFLMWRYRSFYRAIFTVQAKPE
jgi:putative oxidoreductase